MSRHSLFTKDDHSFYNVVVGWDERLQSYFLQYGDVCSDLPLILATGQRPFEHPSPEIILQLAEHLADKVPSDLVEKLSADRLTEGFIEGDECPQQVRFTTQADDGRELGFEYPRKVFEDPRAAGLLADHIISGDAERWPAMGH